jgi:hypothetical protein
MQQEQNPALEKGSEYAEYIDAKAGDISAVVVGFSKAPTKFQPDCVIVELQLEDGTRRALWLTSTVLASQMAKVAPDIGERIHVSYKGKREGANGEYHDFVVTAPERQPFKPDWGTLVDETFEP